MMRKNTNSDNGERMALGATGAVSLILGLVSYFLKGPIKSLFPKDSGLIRGALLWLSAEAGFLFVVIGALLVFVSVVLGTNSRGGKTMV